MDTGPSMAGCGGGWGGAIIPGQPWGRTTSSMKSQSSDSPVCE